jgi:hypothetical protein
MREWGMDEQSLRIQTCVCKVLNELEPAALLYLKDPRFEVVVLPELGTSIWAHFAVRIASHGLIALNQKKVFRGERLITALVACRDMSAEYDNLTDREREEIQELLRFDLSKRLLAQGMRLNPRTRVLLAFCTATCESTPVKVLQDQIRDHIGHVLLYLRDPKARNGCPEAMREWRKYVLVPETKKAAAARRARLKRSKAASRRPLKFPQTKAKSQ